MYFIITDLIFQLEQSIFNWNSILHGGKIYAAQKRFQNFNSW